MLFLAISFLFSAVLCVLGVVILSRLLPATFLAARMNSRSNHTVAARQIGGLALIPATLAALLIFGADLEIANRLLLCLIGASTLLWVVGGLDDRYELSEIIRLGSQLLAACVVLYGLGPDFRLLADVLPHWLEAALIVFSLLIAINVTNFMDGLDLMTVAGLGLPLAGVALLAALGLAGMESGGLSAATAGGLLGFACFNRPPARVFLGDSGSLPLGLITGTALLLLARETHIVVALILPLYYILDAGSTIIMRLSQGENILKAHSKHAYQVAKRAGWSVLKVVGHVALLNLILIACAVALLALDHLITRVAFLLVAMVATLVLLLDFRGRFRKL
ncbi:MAG: glycosyltransferase family 4 protein [Candidatus Ochrobactrum gambitense]|nr:MAG: glycosyltransferase family 4 protein [Candidatus Ochrobactrum gambitense]WEK16963.1 MAG: glycosyltransferase family 4 protein [Candidatus Ochrobactrum gambitense]